MTRLEMVARRPYVEPNVRESYILSHEFNTFMGDCAPRAALATSRFGLASDVVSAVVPQRKGEVFVKTADFSSVPRNVDAARGHDSAPRAVRSIAPTNGTGTSRLLVIVYQYYHWHEARLVLTYKLL
jgi:hypothetical protein